MTIQKLRLGILVSGNGTNLQAIIDACEAGSVAAAVQVVVSDTTGVKAIERAQRHSIPTFVVKRCDYPSRKTFEETIVSRLREHDVNLVCLAGFMRILGDTLLRAFPNRIINIHPALLPSFPGLDAQRKAWDYGVKISGCSVHFVDRETDHGPIIVQAAVPVLEDDTPDALRERILKEEHRLYPEAIQLIAKGRVTINGRRVHIGGSR